MQFKPDRIEFLSFVSFSLLLIMMGLSSIYLNKTTLFAVSLLMFLTCTLSAMHLFGLRLALKFVVLGLVVGFFAEYMGENYGWFFGDYDFTEALGLRLLGVPVVIPLMWFNLCYIGYVLGNIILYRSPVDSLAKSSPAVLGSIFSALLVTGYDLAADPYMVFVVKAWVMEKTDGWWFGETLQGFFGWFFVAFIILSVFKFIARKSLVQPRVEFKKKHALIPLTIFACSMIFQMIFGSPVETRTMSFFAMGVPLLAAFFSWSSWSWNDSEKAK